MRDLFRLIRNLIGIARVLRTEDGGPLQIVRIEARQGELRDAVRLGEYGFASRPLSGAQAAYVASEGSRGQLIVIGTEDRRHRPQDIDEGEAGLYSILGNRIRVRPDGSIEIIGTGPVSVTAPSVSVESDTTVDVTAQNVSVAAAVAANVTAPAIALDGSMTIEGSLEVIGGVTIAGATQINGVDFSSHVHVEQGDGQPTSPPQ